jgi:hypothetical protein
VAQDPRRQSLIDSVLEDIRRLSGEADVPDNFFDVYPGVPFSLPWSASTDPTVLRIGNLEPEGS